MNVAIGAGVCGEFVSLLNLIKLAQTNISYYVKTIAVLTKAGCFGGVIAIDTTCLWL